jgi:predicted DCC family thiol-disulfide oxidoreductase YuxK
MKPTRIILFDGECFLCSRVVGFILSRDPHGRFRFASLQSPAGKRLLRKHGFSDESPDTFVLLENGRLYIKSAAALRICLRLRGGWPLLYGLRIIPRFFRDRLYDWVARNRYRWFGRSDSCLMPSEELKSRFLDEQ